MTGAAPEVSAAGALQAGAAPPGSSDPGVTGAGNPAGHLPAGSPIPVLVRHPDTGGLAEVTAARLLARLVEAQSARGFASVVLTGGGVGIAVLAGLAAIPGRDALDWSRLEVWWGDERWLGDADPERNDVQARAALLDHVRVDPARVHRMAGSDGSDSPEASAAAYADVLATAGAAADFDVCLLGMGPEGHIASLFPASPGVREHALAVVGVHDCPKPPPERVSLTLSTIGRAAEVWLIVDGAAKADAVARIMAGTDSDQVPAAGAHGRERTLMLVDAGAASRL